MTINKLPETPCLMKYSKVKAICMHSSVSSESLAWFLLCSSM